MDLESSLLAIRTRWSNAIRAFEASLPPTWPALALTSEETRLLRSAEIEGVSEFLSTIGAKRNMLAPCSVLPREILALIFTFLVDLYPAEFPPSPPYERNFYQPHPSRLGWIVVTRVCRHWRAVALSWPLLWSNFAMDDVQPWEVFFQRSRDVPISIHSHRWYECAVERIPILLNHQHHLRQLSLSNIPPYYAEDVIAGLVGPLPHLHMLSISCDILPTSSAPRILPSFLTTVAPNLKTISLVGIIFPWGAESRFLVDIRSEHAEELVLESSQSFSDVVYTLCQLPALKRLTLVNALPGPLAQVANEDLIHLPHLEQLKLLDTSDRCQQLWSLINAPGCADVSIIYEENTNSEAEIAKLLQQHVATLPVTSTYLQVHSALNQSQQSQDYLSLFLYTPFRPGQKGFQVRLSLRTADPPQLLQQLVHAIMKCNIKRVEVEGIPCDSTFFYNMLLPLSTVEQFAVNNDHAGAALAALIPLLKNKSETLFPHLAFLDCTSVNFGLSIDHRGNPLYVHSALYLALEGRRDIYGALPHLGIHECDVKSDWVRGWKEYVTGMGWDGVRGAFCEEADEYEDEGDGEGEDE